MTHILNKVDANLTQLGLKNTQSFIFTGKSGNAAVELDQTKHVNYIEFWINTMLIWPGTNCVQIFIDSKFKSYVQVRKCSAMIPMRQIHLRMLLDKVMGFHT